MHEKLMKLENLAGTLMRIRNLSDIFTFMTLNRKWCSATMVSAAFDARNRLNADIYDSPYRNNSMFKAAASRLQAILANFA